MRPLIKLSAGVTALACSVLSLATAAGAQPARADRVAIEYALPTNPAHKQFYDVLKERQVLEHVRDILAGIRWPRTLRLVLKGCDGDANAWYEDGEVTVCYDYLEDMWRKASASSRPPGISQQDAFVGPLVDTILHEAGHALFDLLKIPLLGREEDAADQVAAYLTLQLPKEQKRRLILGGAYGYASELQARNARDLNRLRLKLTRHSHHADVHGTAAQRLYNLLCVAYGSDKELFADAVEKGFLPPERAEICEDEYRQIDFAYRTLIAPHVDGGR
jgi:Putative metallopeptidase